MKEMTVSTGEFVRNYLLEHKEAYIFEIYRALNEYKRQFGLIRGSYGSFRANYINKLKKIGAIQFVREEKSSVTEFKNRRYYRITQGFEKRDDIWSNPQKYWSETKR